MDKALTLKEVADLLGLSYSTIFANRKKIGFRLPGSRVWRVWPADLEKLRPQPSVRLETTLRGGAEYLPHKAAARFVDPMRARKAAKELDELLERESSKLRRKSSVR